LTFQRRSEPRVPVPPGAGLRCELRVGALSFEATLVDISLGGIGTLVYDARVQIEPGTRIERARLVHPQHPPVAVALEIRHIAKIIDRHGRDANRAGCRLFGAQKDIEDLVKLFIAGLE
jgi:c-di-GMP-binding flagellar brake protein YcgR